MNEWISLFTKAMIEVPELFFLASRCKLKPFSGCWEWQGSKSGGYGQIISGRRLNKSRKVKRASRLIYETCYGPIPDEKCVCHHCDNTCCINPEHLFLGTRADNNLDKMRKGRQSCLAGEKNPRAKLNTKQVLEIRKEYSTGAWSFVRLARKYRVGPTAIGKIVSGEGWKNV